MNKTITHKNEIQLLKNNSEFINQNIYLIRDAQKYIFFQTYIFIEDETTQPLLNALIRQAKKGLLVFVLIDAMGSPNLSEHTIESFKLSGIQFQYFTPLFRFSHIGRRLHQKILIVDNRFAIVGGINYGKIFQAPDSSLPWLDYACCVEGQAVNDLYQKLLPLYLKEFSHHKTELLAIKNDLYMAKKNCLVKVNINDWMRYKQDIYKSYLTAISNAEREVILLATYFIPNKKLLKTLKKAADRGVKVHLIFGSESDLPVVDLVCDYFYEWYLNQGIKVYEWKDSIVHGKIAVIDDHWSTIGSYNHNYICQYGNIEGNLEIHQGDFAKLVKKELLSIMHRSQEITHSHLQKGLFNKIKIYGLYLLTNIIIFISITLIYRRKD